MKRLQAKLDVDASISDSREKTDQKKKSGSGIPKPVIDTARETVGSSSGKLKASDKIAPDTENIPVKVLPSAVNEETSEGDISVILKEEREDWQGQVQSLRAELLAAEHHYRQLLEERDQRVASLESHVLQQEGQLANMQNHSCDDSNRTSRSTTYV